MDYDNAYQLYTSLKLIMFISTIILIPMVFMPKKEYSLPIFFLLTGLVSFGFMYESERGQSYSLVFALVIISIWLFQNYYENRFLRYSAYGLFTLSIQMKLTPVVFVIFFIKDWKSLRGNLLRIVSLGSVNLLLVFSLGFKNALDFFNSILVVGTTASSFSGMENHSIKSYVTWVQSTILGDISNLSKILTGFVVVCLLFLAARYVLEKWRKDDSNLDALLFMGLALAILLIPNENHDYTLAILPVVLSVGFYMELSKTNCRLNGMDLFILSFLYSITLFTNALKPNLLFIQNNCLPILLMLVYLTVSAWKKELVFFLTGSQAQPVQISKKLDVRGLEEA